MRIYFLSFVMILSLIAEIGFARLLNPVSDTDNFSAPPSLISLQTEALTDNAFAFRLNAMAVQHTGNLNGKIIPYYQLNYTNLSGWLSRLDQLDSEAEITPTMAAFLFGSTQNAADTHFMIDYLEHRAQTNPNDWRWLAQAVYLARYRLQDLNRAQYLAHELGALPLSLPSWARDLEVFVLVDKGEKAQAKRLLDTIAASDPALPANEKRWMQVYAERNLGKS